jgi:hypothetical protein
MAPALGVDCDGTMTRTLAAAAFLLIALAGCSTPAPPAPEVTTAPSSEPVETSSPSAESPSAEAEVDGCTLVPASLFLDNLLIDPGTSTSSPSFTAGPSTCSFEFASLQAQFSNQPDLYFPESAYDGHDLPGSLPVTTADRGYAIDGSLLVVKGTLAVFVTGYVPDSTPEQWRDLADAIAASIG